MNWVLITVGLIFLICIIVGICRGAIRIAVSLATTLLTLLIVFFAVPYVASGIAKFTPIDDMIEKQVVSTMANAATDQLTKGSGLTESGVKKALEAAGVTEEMLSQYGVSVSDIVNGNITSDDLAEFGISGNVLDGLSDGQKSSVEDAVSNADIPRELQIEAIDKADLPSVFKALLSENNNSEMYSKLGVSTFAQYAAQFLSKLVINIIAFLCTFILVTIVMRAIVFALDIVSNLPVLGFFNRLAGGVVGIIGALIIVWTLFVIVTLVYTAGIGQDIYHTIQNDQILKTLYDYNPIMKLAVSFK